MGALDGRTAIVTGAASGIGGAIARHFAAAGATLVLVDRDPGVAEAADALAAAGHVVADLTDQAAVTDAVAQAESALGRIDTLVTSHGILTESAVVDMPLAQWDQTLAVDLTSVFLLCRAVLPGMLARRDGGS